LLEILHGVDVRRVARARYRGDELRPPSQKHSRSLITLVRKVIPDLCPKTDWISALACIGRHHDRSLGFHA
jgi:hypothetical protein